MVRSFRFMSAAVCLAVVVGVTTAEARQAPVMAAPTVNGNNVTFNWSATAGATAYRLEYGVASGSYLGGLTLGAGSTTFGIGAPNGVFFIRVVAVTPGGELASNEVVLQVPAPPAAPTNLQVARNGTGFVAVWTPGGGGGTPSGFRLYASLSPGGAPLAVLPSAIAAWGIGGGVPPGLYYLRVTAVNAVGESAASNEVAVAMSVSGDCDAPPTPTLTTSAWGPILSASWTPITGASQYLFNYAGPGVAGQVPFAGNQSRFSVRGISAGTWQFSIQAVFACGRASGAGASTLVVDNSQLKMEPRAADPVGPTPPNYLPLPNRYSVVERLAREYPHEMRNSCGNHAFLYRLVAELRKEDKRWGLNWKRSVIGDMSHDVINYNFGSEPDEGTRQTHVVDIISGHCGPNPGPAWIDQTVLFTTGATWTLIPYIEAGHQP